MGKRFKFQNVAIAGVVCFFSGYGLNDQLRSRPIEQNEKEHSSPAIQIRRTSPADSSQHAISQLEQDFTNVDLAQLKWSVTLWARESPEQALAYLKNLPYSPSRQVALRTVFETWAETDPEEAIKQAGAQLTSVEFFEVRDDLVSSWARHSVDEALVYWKDLPNDAHRHRLLQRLSYEIAGRDVDEAMRLLAATSHPMIEDLLRYSIINEMAKREPDKAIQWIQETEKGVAQNQSLSALVSGVAQYDPKKASAILKHLPEFGARDEIQLVVAREWSIHHLEEAFQWIGNQPSGRKRDALYQAAAHHFAYNKPEDAAQKIDQMPAAIRAEMAGIIGESLAIKDPVAAFQWVETLADPAVKQEALGSTIRRWAQQDPAQALKYAVEVEANHEDRNAMLRFIIDPLAADHPEAASASLDQFPEGEIRAEALATIAKNWYLTDPEKAHHWLLNLPENGAYNEAITRVATGVVETNPGYALDLLNTIPDEGIRLDSANAILADLLLLGAEEATRTVVNSSLSQSEKEQLQEQIENMKR